MTTETSIMFCIQCKQQLPPDAFFCPNCGQKVEPPSDAPAGNASADGSNPSAAGQTGCAGAPDRIESYLNYAIVITILAVFNCGSIVNLVLGIAAIVYASKVDRNLLAGDRKEAEACAQTAKMLCMIATGVIALQLLLVLFVFFAIMICLVLPILLQ
ncbi:MAG: CD225/dispanin family protein [Lentisphaeria bacterium]|nr:CD225/dispanin family protein [Lentisphaeria bacterium]